MKVNNLFIQEKFGFSTYLNTLVGLGFQQRSWYSTDRAKMSQYYKFWNMLVISELVP